MGQDFSEERGSGVFLVLKRISRERKGHGYATVIDVISPLGYVNKTNTCLIAQDYSIL